MKKKLDEVMNETFGVIEPYKYDIRDEVSGQWQGDVDGQKRQPSFTATNPPGEQLEPMDKVMIEIQHHFINGEYDKANILIDKYRTGRGKGCFFSAHHMNQLIDWVRNIYKYTNLSDVNKNYYNNQIKQEIEGAKDLKAVKVKQDLVDKLKVDIEKTLKKKLEMR